MKKFMLMMTVAASAGILQAAQIGWNAGANSGLAANGYIYAMTGTSSDYNAVLAALGVPSGTYESFMSYYNAMDSVFSGGPYGANSHVSLGSGQTNAGGALLSTVAGGSPDVFPGSSMQGVFFVMFNNANPALATEYTISYRNQQTLNATGTLNFSTTWANWQGMGQIGTGSWQPVIPVPEPTAMALVALGAAAVGLRRRFRK